MHKGLMEDTVPVPWLPWEMRKEYINMLITHCSSRLGTQLSRFDYIMDTLEPCLIIFFLKNQELLFSHL